MAFQDIKKTEGLGGMRRHGPGMNADAVETLEKENAEHEVREKHPLREGGETEQESRLKHLQQQGGAHGQILVRRRLLGLQMDLRHRRRRNIFASR